MNNNILLTIVMPVFNNADLTRQMIESIRANSFQLWELLAVDDGSDQVTVSVLNQMSCIDPRIQIIHRNRLPKGAQTCRNIGLELAKGKYIIFFDNDDYVLPHCLETRVSEMESNQLLDFMVFPSGVISQNVFDDKAGEFVYGYPIYSDDINAFARRLLPFVVWNNIYRTQSLRDAGIIWDEQLLSLQDADFNLQTLLKGLKYGYSRNRADIGYRIDSSNGSISKRIASKAHQKSTIYAIEKFYQLYHHSKGHKYDGALFFGVLFLYNRIMSNGIDADFAHSMIQVVKRHSPIFGVLFLLAVKSTLLLQVFLPRKIARQIPMSLHLVDYRIRIQHKIKKIRKLKKKKKKFQLL